MTLIPIDTVTIHGLGVKRQQRIFTLTLYLSTR